MVLINPRLGDRVLASNTDETLGDYHNQLNETAKANASSSTTTKKKNKSSDDDEDAEEENEAMKSSAAKWKFYEAKANDEAYKTGHRIVITHTKNVKNIAWHAKGDYFCTVLDDKNSSNSVIMHQLSRQKSVKPFAKMNGIVQQVAFHPSKPVLFVAVRSLQLDSL